MTLEFDLIARYFTRTTRQTLLGVGDDSALIALLPGMELAISADMLVAGTHFFADAAPYTIGWKSLAVNVSDMAAMGAQPKWATLALALPEVNEPWLAAFSCGFFACADAFNIDLIGGDTTRGPLTISVQIMGEVPVGRAIKRSGAKVGDGVWVSGRLGDAALALAHLQHQIVLPDDLRACCEDALHAPMPRVALGLALQGVANSAIDISDGLLADLGHILACSGVGAIVQARLIPHVQHPEALRLALTGGDDYELCFTVPADLYTRVIEIGEQLGLQLSCIGEIVAEPGVVVKNECGEALSFGRAGYDHFS